MSTPLPFTLTIGPVLYYWSRSTLMDFYATMADSPAHTVVLGETVCARRREMRLDDWLGLARDLKAAGKEVLLATQTLIESEADLRLLKHQAEQHEFMLEAGDTSALHLLANWRPFVLGPHINIYNNAALREHARLGATRWVAPVELSLDAVGRINPPNAPVRNSSGRTLATEVWAFGRVPLAFSARCFTARHHHLPRDGCDYRCLADPQGLLLQSSEQQEFLVLNGTQVQSATQQCLLAEGEALRQAGVSRLRLSPTAQHFAQVVQCFDHVMNGALPAAEGLQALQALQLPGGLSNGFAHRRAGMQWLAAQEVAQHMATAHMATEHTAAKQAVAAPAAPLASQGASRPTERSAPRHPLTPPAHGA